MPAIELDTSSSVALLRLNIPPINAFDENALQELAATMEQIDNDPAIRVVIIASAITNVFCAGGDLKYWPRIYPNQPGIISDAGQRTFMRIERLTKPSIAAIQGTVIGDGLSLALACDICLAASNVTFHLPEVKYGFIPGWGTVGRLVGAVGKAFAAEMLFVGEPINAARAQSIGLVNQVTKADNLMPTVENLAKKIAVQPPVALQHAKAVLRGGSAVPSPEQLSWEAACFAEVWGGPEWEQGIRGLFAKTSARRESHG